MKTYTEEDMFQFAVWAADRATISRDSLAIWEQKECERLEKLYIKQQAKKLAQ